VHDVPRSLCVPNHVGAAVASVLRELPPDAAPGRVLVLGLGVTHATRVQEAFYADPAVFTASLHRYENGSCFPFTGHTADCGLDAAVGLNINVPWNSSNSTVGDSEYLAALRTAVVPVASELCPDFAVVSLGASRLALW